MRLAQAAFGLLLMIRVGFDIAVPPIGDEAYYWMWGQRPEWSYLDHPPLHAWLLHIVGLVLGWNLFSLRALTWLTLGGTLWLIWLWSRRLSPANPQAWFWPSAAIYLASPLFFLMSALSFHDHLLIFLALVSSHLFLAFAEKWEAGAPSLRWLYLASIALGLTVLTKYNGVLLGLGIAVFFVARKELRPLWRSPHLYLAALLAVAVQAPVFWWNLTTAFASYKFHLSERWGAFPGLQPLGPLRFIVVAVLFIGPFLVPSIIRLIRDKGDNGFAGRARTLALSVFAASSLTMLALSAFVEVYFYWNILAILPMMPLLAGRMGRITFPLHLAYGVIIAGIAVVNYGLLPLGTLFGQPDWYAVSNFDWPAVAQRISEREQTHPGAFIATTRYSTAAQLGFALHDPDVTALGDRPNEYDYWFDPAAHAGRDALIVADRAYPTDALRSRFESLTKLEDVPVTRFGQTIWSYEIWLGTGYRPASP